MTYSTLMVHLQAGTTNTAVLAVAAQLADRFDAHVIGIAGCQPMMIVGGDGYVCGDVFAEDQRQMTADLALVQEEFRSTLGERSSRLEWRSEISLSPIADYLSSEARGADLVLIASVPPDATNLARVAVPGSLVMQVGRPVIVVPVNGAPLAFRHALVAWKDTRESRRAVCDAVPLLKLFGSVTIVEVAAVDALDAADAGVKDVVHWLQRHGITSSGVVERSTGNDAAQLQALCDRLTADLVVAGAYGHSRLREWAVGGVTRDLLLGSLRCSLVSH